MSGAVSRSLALARMALCPDCGAPLPLGGGAARVECRYCGGVSRVERRLRLAEPELTDSPATANTVGEWSAPHLLAGRARDVARCQGCGGELPVGGLVAAVRCPYCGSDNRVDRRLVRAEEPGPEPDLREVLRMAGRSDGWYVTKLLDVVEGGDGAVRESAARELAEPWGVVNESMARVLPTLVACMERFGPLVDQALAEVLVKFLCSPEEPALRNAALRAAERRAFSPHGTRHLIRALGLGDAPCLKLLMDVASHAHAAGDRVRECQAVAALNWAVQRIGGEEKDYPRDVMLYRLPYLRGTVRDFVVLCLFARRGNGFTYDWETVLRHVDDLAHEEPGLVPLVRHLAPGVGDDEEAWLRRAALVSELGSEAARDAALRTLSFPTDFTGGGPAHTDEGVARVLRTVEPLLDDPALGEAAAAALCEMVETPLEVPGPVTDLVRRRGDRLPEEARRSYLRRVPGTPLLSPLPVRYWHPPDPGVVGSREWLAAELDRMAAAVNAMYAELEALEGG